MKTTLPSMKTIHCTRMPIIFCILFQKPFETHSWGLHVNSYNILCHTALAGFQNRKILTERKIMKMNT